LHPNKKYLGPMFPRKLSALGLMVFALELADSSVVRISGIYLTLMGKNAPL